MDKSSMTVEERLTALESIFLNQKEILNFSEACIYTGISRSTMYKLTASKKIPHYKTVGLHFERAELDNWIRQHRVCPDGTTSVINKR
ncbi:MAG: helix-turn-helix domain-containing protein [Prevotella sp.]|nr:helix-turn-helix domain-containing protein [Prevotella sp.]MBP3775969.1 helix-turn-helix domain-containing protein [Prevotella sp.]